MILNDDNRLRLFSASFLALFIELALIRFIPGYVRAVGYYTNLVLIASFLGLGIGFLLSETQVRMERLLPPLLCLIVAAVWWFSGVPVLNITDTTEPLWLPLENKGSAISLPIGAVVLAHFILCALVLVPVGQIMGRLFGQFPPLRAYALDLAGSLTGVVAFGALSAWRTPPAIWFSLALAVFLITSCRGTSERLWTLVWAGITVAVLVVMATPGEIWSPYYRVTTRQVGTNIKEIYVNGQHHQTILDFTLGHPYVQKTKDRFQIPYQKAKSLDDVLIVGAGTGNDVAIALSMGARHIDAVEIDPVFFDLGNRFHPQTPYQSDRVTRYNTDARAFFRNTDKKYDLIVFGTLDSQALLGHLSSIRLDNYIYTREAFDEAYRLLKPDGLMAVFHMSMSNHIGWRILLLLSNTAGRPAEVNGWKDHTLFNYLMMQQKNSAPGEKPVKFGEPLDSLKIPCDNWPFLYLARPTLPWHYGQVLLGMILTAIVLTGAALRGNVRGFDWRLFWLGAGFLLLEAKSVTQMSLLFGSTWVVNILVFSSILIVLFLANAMVSRWDRQGVAVNTRIPLAILCLVCLAVSFLPVSAIAAGPAVWRWLSGGLLVALPIGLAGLVFPLVFRTAKNVRIGFAANLLGAIVGGCAEYFTMVLGIQSLTIIAGLFYFVALIFTPGRSRLAGS